MPNGAAAEKVLGALAQQRGYLNRSISTWNQIGIAGSIGVWAATAGHSATDGSAVAAAGVLTAILLGVWRWQARFIDNAIVGLYATTLLCERELLPSDDLCTVRRPKTNHTEFAERLSGVDPAKWFDVPNTAFGSRGHDGLDGFAIAVMLITAIVGLWLGVHDGYLRLDQGLCLRLPALVIPVNLGGIVCVIWRRFWWQRQTHRWPLRAGPSPGVGADERTA